MVTKLFEHPQEVKGEALLTSPEKKKKQNIMAGFLAFIKMQGINFLLIMRQ